MQGSKTEKQSKRLLVVVALLVLFHWAIMVLSVGLRVEHVVVDLALIALTLVGLRYSRLGEMALVLTPFWLTGVVYEASALSLPFRGPVHVADLHQMELAFFGVESASGLVPLSTYLQQHTFAALDVFTGAAYIGYVILPIVLVLFWTWRRHTKRARVLAWSFLLVNVLGFTIQLLWPAAPAWYITDYGLGPAVMDAAPSAAGAARFDAALGISYFAGFYSRNVNVFGAMPSLHVSYPTLAALALFSSGWRFFLPAVLFAIFVAFSALYLNHHYVLDLLLGVLSAGLAYGVMRRLHSKTWKPAHNRTGHAHE